MAELQWDPVAFQAVSWKLALVYVSELLVDTVKHSFVIRYDVRREGISEERGSSGSGSSSSGSPGSPHSSPSQFQRAKH